MSIVTNQNVKIIYICVCVCINKKGRGDDPSVTFLVGFWCIINQIRLNLLVMSELLCLWSQSLRHCIEEFEQQTHLSYYPHNVWQRAVIVSIKSTTNLITNNIIDLIISTLLKQIAIYTQLAPCASLLMSHFLYIRLLALNSWKAFFFF